MEEIVIPKENAVFWLDRHGCWRNRHGRFEQSRIIAKFHAAIECDRDGYYLSQINGAVREKVYFHCEDTALFVFDLRLEADTVTLILNTGRQMPLVPETLYIQNDALYVEADGERIRFADRGLMKFSRLLEDDGTTCFYRLGNVRVPIPEKSLAEVHPSNMDKDDRHVRKP
ncbi:MAG: MFS transporter permease [Desulfosarcina sp.]|nr:MFS transporter permease [Desulfobacterales bacterium]